MTCRPADDRQRLVSVTLDERTVVRRSPEIEHERQVAIYDLLGANRFAPKGHSRGPYSLYLSLRDRALIFDIRTEDGSPLREIALPLAPFRRLIKDYFTVCESYVEAIKRAPPSRIEAIDMGRRSLHDEGSELLRERLAGKVDIDVETARRLFTLICVLHVRG